MSELPTPLQHPPRCRCIEGVAGNPPKVRASFAKGRCVRGTYAPSDRAAEITRSLSFTQAIARAGALLGGRRLSRNDGTRQPHAARLQLQAWQRRPSLRHPDRKRSGSLCEDARPDARVPRGVHSGTGRQGRHLEKVKAFSAANPETLHQANYIAARRPPGSFAGTTYWGVHAFPATNAKDETRFIKFKVAPVGGDVTLERGRGQDEVCRLPARRSQKPGRRRRYPLQRDGAARPSRRPHHGRNDPMAGRGPS